MWSANSPSCRIYDPYYCNGAVKDNLNHLGFPDIHNVKEDCYEVWQDPEKCPSFDVLVTNPPYSGRHIERLVHFAVNSGKPWLLLLPNWVHKKDYFLESTKDLNAFYLVPRKRYVYKPPPAFREAKKSDVHKKSSPFCSMWYCYGGTATRTQKWIQQYQRLEATGCDLARSKSALRDLRRKKR